MSAAGADELTTRDKLAVAIAVHYRSAQPVAIADAIAPTVAEWLTEAREEGYRMAMDLAAACGRAAEPCDAEDDWCFTHDRKHFRCYAGGATGDES